jgi:DNA-binding transcriptional LysR family regulator
MLGLRLFERSTRAVALSPEGARLLPYFRASFAAVDRIGLEASKLQREAAGRLEVGYQAGTGLLLMPSVVSDGSTFNGSGT